jgi:hypothetical protein
MAPTTRTEPLHGRTGLKVTAKALLSVTLVTLDASSLTD